jgi:hypothetical protein
MNLFLAVQSRISDRSLRELIGLFFRYRIAVRQLAILQNKRNAAWFCDPEAYWHRRIFRAH